MGFRPWISRVVASAGGDRGRTAGEQAAAEAQKGWLAVDAKTPKGELRKESRNAVGLE